MHTTVYSIIQTVWKVGPVFISFLLLMTVRLCLVQRWPLSSGTGPCVWRWNVLQQGKTLYLSHAHAQFHTVYKYCSSLMAVGNVLLFLPFCRKGRGNPIRTTSGSVEWRGNTRLVLNDTNLKDVYAFLTRSELENSFGTLGVWFTVVSSPRQCWMQSHTWKFLPERI